MRLFVSNRLEILGRILSETLASPLPGPLDREVILVQSKGMEHWIATVLARHHGICANIWFPFPNAFFNWLFKKLVPELPEISPFDPEKMTWDILRCLPDCLETAAFAPLRAYLGDDSRDPGWGVKGLQLADRIADTFDQYLLFRPEMVTGWERGEETHWQAMLWQRLMEGKDPLHRAALVRRFLSAVDDPKVTWEGLPERIAVFGISALPPYHMAILNGLSHVIEVNLFIMNPCREFWGDILPDRELARRSRAPASKGVTLIDLHLEKGNSLLASMGRLGRDFFDLVEGLDPETVEAFEAPPAGTGWHRLLSTIQSHILNLEDAERLEAKIPVAPEDTSIQVHSCHSPMREVEVLHDRILDMLASDPGLQPRDILVMAPDIDAYASFIDAVFAAADLTRRIPYRIADRDIRATSDIVDTFLSILDLPGERFSAPAVLNILESEAVRNCFGLADGDLDLIRKWVEETAIRWGIDETDRAARGVPGLEENTWAAGMKRLLLGYALSGQGERMFQGILPYDDMEGGETAVLGAFVHFVEVLFTRTRGLDTPRTPRAWTDTLHGLLDEMFLPHETDQADVQLLWKAFHDLREMSDTDGEPFEDPVTLNGVRAYLNRRLEQRPSGAGFMTAGMTCCSLLPMRSIPFRVICLLGMNNSDYPRESIRPGFDLMAARPRPGDRSRRHDDRYIFLEALLSARTTLYISYVGQSIQDNSMAPPSVLVSELLDYMDEGFEIRPGTIRDHVVTDHRLQPFHPDYFKKGKTLFSYSTDLLDAARRLRQPPGAVSPFITGRLSEPESEFKAVTVDDLCGFLANPARYLLQKRLGLHLEQETVPLRDSEPFDLEGLERYRMAQDLISRRLAGEDLGALFECRKAAGRLPHGEVGQYTFETLCQDLTVFSDKTAGYMDDTQKAPLDAALDVGGFRLTGRLHNIYPGHLFQHRYAVIKARDRLRIWVHHLVLNAAAGTGYPCNSVLAGLKKRTRERVWWACEYGALEPQRALRILDALLRVYWEGLIRPLHFFPDSAYRYARDLLEKGKSAQEALDAAKRIWTGSDFSRGEGDDPHYRLCFRETDPLDAAFEAVSEEVFGPLLAHQGMVEG
ncbi:MAG: exodeoxyribonuclease V subunit gamma [Deltaproteobacteria bacterium]|nr:exodeoxyribonuclease V subunit gamma [Deltaproteobacteria bacterium]